MNGGLQTDVSLLDGAVDSTASGECFRVSSFVVGSGGEPLFLVMDARTTAALQGSLFGCLGSETSIYALTIGSNLKGFSTLQAVANMLVARLRQLQPHGPYRLAGWGWCGVLIYECAVQLFGADEQVEFVGLVNSECLSWSRRRALAQKCADSSPSPGSFDGLDSRDEGEVALKQMVLAYDVPHYPLCIHLVQSSNRTGAKGVDTERVAMGWESVADVKVHSVPGERDDPPCAEHMLAIDRGIRQARSRPPSERNVPAEYRSLIRIQRGGFGASKAYCVPGAGATVTDFVSFAGALGQEYEVYGFQPRGVCGKLVPHTSVEAAANCHLNQMHSPSLGMGIHLVGHSFGGWVALEMALKLQEMGRPPASLILLDSECPSGQLDEYTRPEALMRLVALYEQALERPLDIALDDFEGRGPDAQLEFLHARLVQARLLPPSAPSVMRGPIATFETAIRTAYAPNRTFNGDVRLVMVPGYGEDASATEQRIHCETEAWRQLAPNLRVLRGTGNHMTLLSSPHVEAAAAWAFQHSNRPVQNSAASTGAPARL